MTTQWLTYGTLAVVLGVALGHDLATRRIPNWLVASALLAAVVLNVLTATTAGFLSGAVAGLGKTLLGALTGLVVMLPLYLLHAMGAGDVKLMAAVGAFLGPLPTLGAVLLVFLAGGVLSLAAALCSGTLKRVADNLRWMALGALSGCFGAASGVQTTGRLPYALAITAGTALQLWAATQASWPFK